MTSLKKCQEQQLYNNSKSETKNVSHGVPQGSIIGLLFFIVFMNDCSRESKLYFLSSSLMIHHCHLIIIILFLTLNIELKKIDVCLQANKITLNTYCKNIFY